MNFCPVRVEFVRWLISIFLWSLRSILGRLVNVLICAAVLEHRANGGSGGD